MLVPKPEIKIAKREEIEVESNPEQLSDKERPTTVLDLNPTTIPSEKRKLTQEEVNSLMKQINLSGIKDWNQKSKKRL